MSRRISSSGGKKGSSNPFAAKTRMFEMIALYKNGASMRQLIESKKSHRQVSHKEKVEDALDDKMYNPNKKKTSTFSMPGTQSSGEKEMTKGYKAAMEMAYTKKLKKKIEMRAKRIEIKAQSFGSGENGGRVTADGRVMNAQGRILLRINPNNGLITDNMGLKVGKYDPNSMVNESRIEKLIARYNKQTSTFNPFAPKT